jgi:exosome complex component RRP46
MGSNIAHHVLDRADGSATYSSLLYTILSAVNGPVDVQRRDELPEEAAIEVNVRPLSGVGGPRERWLESVVAGVLKSALLVHMHPRTLVQVTLQITKGPVVRMRKVNEDVAVLPALINAAFLALVDGGLPLQSTIVAGLFATSAADEVSDNPGEREVGASKSLHTFAYNLHGEMLLNESVGDFGIELWEQVADRAQRVCLAAMAPAGEDQEMANGGAEAMPWLRQELEGQARKAVAWREET